MFPMRSVVPTAMLAAALAVAAPVARATAPAGAPPAARQPAPTEAPYDRAFRAGARAEAAGDRAEARRQYEDALRSKPDHLPAVLGLASVAMTERDDAEVERRLRQAEAIQPSSAVVQLGWGRYHASRQRPAEAEAALKRAQTLAPTTVAPLVALGELYSQWPGRERDALETFQAAVEREPRSGPAQMGLGIALAKAGRAQEAVGKLETAAQLMPQTPAPLQVMGRVYMQRGESATALAAFDRALARRPDAVPLMLDRASALSQARRWDEALAQLRDAEAAAPRSADVATRIGDVNLGAKRHADAERAYRRAIELAPSSPVPLNNLAWLLATEGGDTKEAVALARRAVSLAPDNWSLQDTLGWAERAAGNLEAAEAALRRATELGPGAAAPHLHLGTVLAERGNPTEARRALERAVELDPQGETGGQARARLASLPK
jgi:tetratricopeptide (TPR) repeat protein